MKILIVDDNCEMREMMKFYLRGCNAEFRECCDGCDALGAYTAFLPDWVLMDWEMKKTDGLAATEQIVSGFPDARIIFLTQHDEVELRTAAQEAGACGFVLKDDLQALRELFASQTAQIKNSTAAVQA